MLVGVERLSFNDPNRGQHTKPVGDQRGANLRCQRLASVGRKRLRRSLAACLPERLKRRETSLARRCPSFPEDKSSIVLPVQPLASDSSGLDRTTGEK